MADALIEGILSSYEDKSLSELQSSIAKIETEIHNNVTHHHSDLLAQTSNVELMDDVVVNTLSRTKACLTNVQKIGTNLEENYANLRLLVTKLENLYEARQKIATFQEVLKYSQMIESERDLADVAMYVANIEFLCASAKLDKLKPYRDKAAYLSQNIEKQTENIMMQGLDANSYNQVSSSLQIFVNLNTLNAKITKVLSETEKLVERDVKAALNVKIEYESGSGPGRAASSKVSETSKKKVWLNLDNLVIKLIVHTGKVKFLHHVLKTGKDLTSNLNFDAFVDEALWTKFWNSFLEILVQNVGTVQMEFIKNLFEDEFPKLLSVITFTSAQIEDCGALNVSVSLNAGLRGVTLNYEKAFLSKSLAKLFDSVNHIFAKPSCPSTSDIDPLIRLIHKEMDLEDPMLKKLVSRNITKTVQLVCVRTEQLICNDGNSTQVIGPATESQISNAKLVNFLDHFRSQLRAEICEPVGLLMGNIMNPLVQAVGDTIEAILLTMHQENFKRTTRATEYSLYMGELSNFISRVAKDYFNLYNSNEIVQKSCYQLSIRTMKSLIINISLISNLNSDLKKQLLVDLNHVEVALTPICPVLQDGLRFLRAFRNILQMSIEELQTSNLVGSVVPHSYVIQVVINQTGGKIRPPHVVNNWSIPRYLRWLEEHSEQDKIRLLNQTMENYVLGVTSKGQTEYHPYYPSIMDLMRNSYSE